MKKINLLLIFLTTVNLSWGQEKKNKKIDRTYKYKYTINSNEWDINDSTRVLADKDLLSIEYFNEKGVKTVEELYENGELTGGKKFVYNERDEYQGTIPLEIGIEKKNYYDNNSFYGVVKKSIDKYGLEQGEKAEIYKEERDTEGRLIKEWILDQKNDTLRHIRHYYNDSGGLMRIEDYKKDTLIHSRMFIHDNQERWNKMILINREGEITSTQEMRYQKISEHIVRGTSILTVEGHKKSYPTEVIWYYNGEKELLKSVIEDEDEVKITEFRYIYKE